MLELLSMVALTAAWLIPNHYPPWTSIYNETAAGLSVILLGCGLAKRLAGAASPKLVVILLIVATIPWLQWVTGLLHFRSDAFVSSLYVLLLAGAISTSYESSRTNAQQLAAMLSCAALGGGVISAVLALLQICGVRTLGIWAVEPVDGMRAVANFGQPNNLASFLSLAAISAWYLFERNRLKGHVAVSLVVLMLVACAATQSRTGILQGLIPICLYGVACRRGVRINARLGVVVGLVGICWILTFLFPVIRGWFAYGDQGASIYRGAGSRLTMWKVFLSALSDSPWVGFGWLQLGDARLAVSKLATDTGELWLHGHNLFLELLLWMGVPLGGLLCVGAVAWYLLRWVTLNSLEGLIGMAVVTIIGIHTMLELPHHYAYFIVPVGFWIGLVEATSPGLMLVRIPVGGGAVPLIGALLLGCAIWRHYPEVEEDFRWVRFQSLGIGPTVAPLSTPDAIALDGLVEFLNFARTEPTVGMSAQALKRMELVVRRYPYAASMAKYSYALALNGRLPDAEEMFRAILVVHDRERYERAKHALRLKINEGETDLIPLQKVLSK